MPKAAILTEAGKGVGSGHLTRCLALYQELERRGCHVRILVNGDKSVRPLLCGTHHALTDWRSPGTLTAALRGADIAIIDSYLAKAPTYETISKSVPVPAYLDDDQRLRYPRGVVINSNAHAPGLRYPGRKGMPHLLGLRYALLRREFRDAPPSRCRPNPVSILITTGGQDKRRLVPTILRAVNRRHPYLVKRVVIGASFGDISAIKAAADARTKLIFSPDAAGMKRLMRTSDIAICAGGQTVNELARLGIPALVVIVAENQRLPALSWQRLGAIRCCGDWTDPDIGPQVARGLERLLVSHATRRAMAQKGRRQIDGRGAERISNRLLAICKPGRGGQGTNEA